MNKLVELNYSQNEINLDNKTYDIYKKINITEKFDGFGIRFGLDQDKRFFIESSRSGPVFDAGTFRNFAIKKFGSSNPIAEGYEDIFITLQQNPKLQAVLKKYWEPSGLKVIAEALYLPNKKEEIKEGDDDYVVFVATRYKKPYSYFVGLSKTDDLSKWRRRWDSNPRIPFGI